MFPGQWLISNQTAIYVYHFKQGAVIEHVQHEGVTWGLAGGDDAPSLHLHQLLPEVIFADLVFSQQFTQNVQTQSSHVPLKVKQQYSRTP